jgi:peptidoglycan hydrolase CwlO-like protein
MLIGILIKSGNVNAVLTRERKMPKVSNHSAIMTAIARFEERQKTLFNQIDKIENHLSEINGKVQSQEIQIAKIQTYGATALLVTPIIINFLMRLI